jgi:hypothetical protein
MFEVILIVSILFLGIYFLLYHFYFDTHCLKRDGLIWADKHTTMILMWQCRDSYVCSIENISSDDLKRNITAWECNKVKVNYFEPTYYKSKISNLLK